MSTTLGNLDSMDRISSQADAKSDLPESLQQPARRADKRWQALASRSSLGKSLFLGSATSAWCRTGTKAKMPIDTGNQTCSKTNKSKSCFLGLYSGLYSGLHSQAALSLSWPKTITFSMLQNKWCLYSTEENKIGCPCWFTLARDVTAKAISEWARRLPNVEQTIDVFIAWIKRNSIRNTLLLVFVSGV